MIQGDYEIKQARDGDITIKREGKMIFRAMRVRKLDDEELLKYLNDVLDFFDMMGAEFG